MFNKKHKIGDVISKFRKEKGWTQIELAEKLQVSRIQESPKDVQRFQGLYLPNARR